MYCQQVIHDCLCAAETLQLQETADDLSTAFHERCAHFTTTTDVVQARLLVVRSWIIDT